MIDDPLVWRRDNFGYLLNATSQLFLRQKHAFVKAHGFAGVTETQLFLLFHMNRDGTRMTELAARTGFGKSSLSELASRTQRAGLVARRVDPLDSRAVIILFTPVGTAALACAEVAIAEGERSLARSLGESVSAGLKDALLDWLVCRDHTAGSINAPTGVPAWRQSNIGRLLALGSRRFVSEVVRLVCQEGHDTVGEPLLTLFRNIDLKGSRLTDLAVRARITKQSMREIIARASALGLVERLVDGDDARARQIRFTDRGLALLESIGVAVMLAEEGISATLGTNRLHSVKGSLRSYLAAAAGGTDR